MDQFKGAIEVLLQRPLGECYMGDLIFYLKDLHKWSMTVVTGRAGPANPAHYIPTLVLLF